MVQRGEGMTLPLSPDTLAAAYDYLRTTPPFNRWNLPDSEDVLFSVVKTPRDYGWYQWDGKRHTISASKASIGHTVTLMRLMAHEMIHLHLEETGMESKNRNNNTHNAAFRKIAATVCRVHGLDPKAFY